MTRIRRAYTSCFSFLRLTVCDGRFTAGRDGCRGRFASVALQFQQPSGRQRSDLADAQQQVVVPLESLFDLGAHQRVHAQIGQSRRRVDVLRVLNAEDVADGVDQTHLTGAARTALSLLGQNH